MPTSNGRRTLLPSSGRAQARRCNPFIDLRGCIKLTNLVQEPVPYRTRTDLTELDLKSRFFPGKSFVQCRRSVGHGRSFQSWAGALPSSQSPIWARRQCGDEKSRCPSAWQGNIIRTRFTPQPPKLRKWRHLERTCFGEIRQPMVARGTDALPFSSVPAFPSRGRRD
jgi:hypothetical protein